MFLTQMPEYDNKKISQFGKECSGIRHSMQQMERQLHTTRLNQTFVSKENTYEQGQILNVVLYHTRSIPHGYG
jgi:hypothetical protein